MHLSTNITTAFLKTVTAATTTLIAKATSAFFSLNIFRTWVVGAKNALPEKKIEFECPSVRKPSSINLRREKKIKRRYNAFLKGVITPF